MTRPVLGIDPGLVGPKRALERALLHGSRQVALAQRLLQLDGLTGDQWRRLRAVVVAVKCLTGGAPSGERLMEALMVPLRELSRVIDELLRRPPDGQ